MAQSGLSGAACRGAVDRCATSISANAHEAQEGQSKPDFIAKMSVSRTEAREANMWLRFAVATGMVQPSDVTWELQESIELLRMIRQTIRTARSRPDRGNSDWRA